MTFRRIASWADLPGDGPKQARETYELDFKGTDPDGTFACDAAEMAKDIAAFANMYGGSVLAGISEHATSYAHAKLLLADAPKVARKYEDAARDLLAPRPIIDVVTIEAPDRVHALVAVNVAPYPDQLIGARAAKSNDAWRFPIRTASRHTKCIDPEAAMLYANPKTRKAAILLAAIRPGMLGLVFVRQQTTTLAHRYRADVELEASFGGVDFAANHVSMTMLPAPGREMFGVIAPLEDVVSVWHDATWRVRLAGEVVQSLSSGGPAPPFTYRPAPIYGE